MTDDDLNMRLIRRIVWCLLALMVLLAFCSSCKSTKVVTVEKVQHDSIYVANTTLDSTFMARVKAYTDSIYTRDSLYVHDSVYVFQKGDTLTITKEKEVFRDRWYEKIVQYTDTLAVDKLVEVHDTAYIERVDSIPYEVIVEKQLTRWQRWKMRLGGWAMGALSGLVLAGAGWAVWKWKFS